MNYLPYPVTRIGHCADQPVVDQKIQQTRQKLNEVMGVMRENISRLSERSERLENLASRAEVLDMSASCYQNSAREVKKASEESSFYKVLLGAVLVCVFVSGIIGHSLI